MSATESKDSCQNFVSWITDYSQKVKDVEISCTECLNSQDSEKYTALLRKKAELLASMHREAASLIASLPEDKASSVNSSLRRFSASASQSLQIGSSFYMSALLYPEDHTLGQPNDLDLWIKSFAGSI